MGWTGVLLVEGVKGETEKAEFKEHIDVMSCNMGITNHAQLDTSGWSSGRATASEFSFMLKGGSAAVQLESLCAKGATINKVTLKELKSANDATLSIFKTTEFTNCKVTHVQESASDGSDSMNSVGLAYGEKKVDYKEQKTEGGTMSNAANYHFDFKQSKSIA